MLSKLSIPFFFLGCNFFQEGKCKLNFEIKKKYAKIQDTLFISLMYLESSSFFLKKKISSEVKIKFNLGKPDEISVSLSKIYISVN